MKALAESFDTPPPRSATAGARATWLRRVGSLVCVWLLVFSTSTWAADRFVRKTGSDTGSCLSSRCLTIGYALSQAAASGDRIIIEDAVPSAYAENLIISKSVELVGTGSDPLAPNFTSLISPVSGSDRTIITVRAAGVVVRDLLLSVDLSTTNQAIRAESSVAPAFTSDGLDIRNVLIRAESTGPITSIYGLRNAIFINPDAGPHFSVTVQNSRIDGTLPATFFRAGVDATHAAVTISGNDIATINHDLKLSGVSGVNVISGNTLRYGGIDIGSYNNSAGVDTSVTISGNNFFPGQTPAFPGLRLITNTQVNTGAAYVPTMISGNFFGRAAPDLGLGIGIFAQNYPNVTISGNDFHPLLSAPGFSHIIISNKTVYTNAPPDAPVTLDNILIRGNNFRGNASSTTGHAIEFLNHNNAGGTAQFGSNIIVGGAGADINNFSADLDLYVRLSPESGATATNPYYYSAPAVIPATEMAPYSGNVTAVSNLFGAVDTSGATTASQQSSVIAKIFDQRNVAALGQVQLGFGERDVVYVDDAYIGQSYGQESTFSHGNPAASGQLVYFGVDAFDNLQDALDAVSTAGTIYVAGGVYAAGGMISREVTVIGDDGGVNEDTTFQSTININASGSSAAQRLVLRNLTVTNTVGDGIRLLGSRSFIGLDGVSAVGNAQRGFVAFNNDGLLGDTLTTDLLVQNSHFDGNGVVALGAGMLFDEDASVNGLRIENSTFNGNGGAGLTFNDLGAPSSIAQIRNIVIDGSEFSRNNPADTGNGGGGLWLKTSGAGSLIENVLVQNSTFADNGTGQTNGGLVNRKINANGISIRARPNTVIDNVVICNNTFAETASPSLQEAGIYVFDDTLGTNQGYQPVEVCTSNTFAGLLYSVSGHEQRGARNTQPVVNISGPGVLSPAPEEINVDYVLNENTLVTYRTINAAIAAATPGDSIYAPAGLYSENVLIDKNNLILRGESSNRELTIIDGRGRPGSGVTIANGVTGVTIRDLTVRDFTAIGTSSGACIYGALTNNGTSILSTKVQNCAGGSGGIFLSAGNLIDDIEIDGNDVSMTDGRGIVIWDGLKSNIRITNNNVHDLSGCCGIELQDGRASAVTVTGNTLSNIGDAAMGFVQLDGSIGPNLIASNTISNFTGRFGIELKIPNGSGADNDTAPGAIIVRDNSIAHLGTPSRTEDTAGIAVIRRSFINQYGQVDTTSGVVIKNNIITGWTQPSGNEGYGIVVEGDQMTVYGNTVSGSDIGIQRQAGNASATLPGDSNQADSNTWFSRGNAPLVCADLGVNTLSANGSNLRDVLPAGVSADAVARNDNNGRRFCTVQAAIDDALTVAGHAIHIYRDQVLNEQLLVNKSVRLTRAASGALNPILQAPSPTNGDLAIIRVAAPDVEIDNLAFLVDLSRVGEAIRTVGNQPSGDPQGISIHDNLITSTSTANAFVSYGRRNAISLNMSNSSGYAPAGEQVSNLSVNIANNTITGTQDWDGGSVDRPAYFRSAISLDQGAGTISGNTLRGRDYDAFVRFTNGTGLLIDSNQMLAGGLYVGDGIATVTVSNNNLTADRSLLPFADFPPPINAGRWGDLGLTAARLVNVSDTVVLSGNTFGEQTNSVFAQNFADLQLVDNDFQAPSHGSVLRHLILSNKVMSSSSATVPSVPLQLSARENTFSGSASHDAVAVELLNHDADAAVYGNLQFGDSTAGVASNAFTGDFDFYFRLDPTSCATSNTCAPEPYQSSYAYASTPATQIAPFAGDVLARDNTFDGTLPNAMSAAQVEDLQDRTYHNDPLVVESPAAPVTLGRVEFGLAAGTIPTTTTVVSTAPVPSNIGEAVVVTVAVQTTTGGTPTGTVNVVDAGNPAVSCAVAYPASNSCSLSFQDSGLRTVQASFSDGAAADSSGTRSHLVLGAGGVVVVTSCSSDPGCTASPIDNDFTRINDAVQVITAGSTLVLDGNFDWTEANAAASWAAASYRISVPAGRPGVTITAAALGDAVIQGPGDLAAANLEGVFFLSGSASYQNWEFSNLRLLDFDLGIGMFFGADVTAFSGVRVINNVIRVPADLNANDAPVDVNQNIGLHLAFGQNQEIRGNDFELVATGVSAGTVYSTSVAIQSNTSGGGRYDGLVIAENDVRITGAAGSPRIISIWENASDYGAADITLRGNRILNQTGSAPPADPVAGWRGFMLTSHSSAAKTVLLQDNVLEGLSVGVTTLIGFPYTPAPGSLPIQFRGNTLQDNVIGLRADSDNAQARFAANFNRLVGNTTAIQVISADVNAENNWWGCNGGPGEQPGGCSAPTNDVVGTADIAPWLTLAVSALPATVNLPDSSTITASFNRNSDGVDVSADSVFPTGVEVDFVTLPDGDLTPVSNVTTDAPRGDAQSSLAPVSAGVKSISAAADDQIVSTDVLVTAGNSVTVVSCTSDLAPCTPTALDNDYTRINRAVQLLSSNTTLVLQGEFNFTEVNALASWTLGTDGVAATTDDWSVRLPAGLEGVTITAANDQGAANGGATISGAGDVATFDNTKFLFSAPGTYRNWTVSNLHLLDFERTLVLVREGDDDVVYGGTPGDAYSGLHVHHNTIRVPADLSADATAGVDGSSNVGIRFGTGLNIVIEDNRVEFAGTGDSSASRASSIGIFNSTSGGGFYDGLIIRNNEFVVLGAPLANPERIIALWENSNAATSGILIADNRFTGQYAAGFEFRSVALLASTASAASQYTGNTVSGWGYGFSYLAADIFPPFTLGGIVSPTELRSNDFSSNATAIRAIGGGSLLLRDNRIVANQIGVAQADAGSVDAQNNWWGCNAGPGAQPFGCASTTNGVTGTVDASAPISMSVSATAPIIVQGNNTPVTATLNLATGNFPGGGFNFSASSGSVLPASGDFSGAQFDTVFTSSIAGGVTVSGSFDAQTVSTLVTVQPAGGCGGGPCSYTVLSTQASGDTPSALDNDYTRINNAVQVLANADTLTLQGDFDWTEVNARLSWSRGSDGIPGNGDDYSVKLPPSVNDAVIQAAAPATASITGDQGTAASDFTAFVVAFGAPNRGWTVRNLAISGFDIAIGLFASSPDDFDGTVLSGNLINVPADIDDDSANYGIYAGYGDSQQIRDNAINIDIGGDNADGRYVGVQIGDSCNNACFDGLIVAGNTVSVSGIPATPATPPRLLGIWENAGDGNSSVTIEDNQFSGSGDLGSGVAANVQTGLILSTQSNTANGKLAITRRNHISGAAIGITTQNRFGYFTAAPDALRIEGNTLLANGDGIRITAGLVAAGNPSKADIHFNRLVGNVQALVIEDTSLTFAPGDPSYGGPELPSVVNARDNWFGCNAGPLVAGDCDPVLIMNGVGAAATTLDRWLTLSLTPAVPVAPLGASVPLVASLNRTSSGDDLSGSSRFPVDTNIAFALVGGNNSVLATPTAVTGNGAQTPGWGLAANGLTALATTQTVSATLDGQTVEATVVVEQVLLAADLPAALAQNVTSQPFNVLISNQGAALGEPLSVSFVISATPTTSGVTIEYQCGPVWCPVTLSAGPGDTLQGLLPVGALAAMSNIEVPTRVTFANVGPHQISATLRGDSSGISYADDGGTLLVIDPAQVQVTVLSGSPQTAPVNGAYVLPLVAVVSDGAGNALSGVSVDFASSLGGAQVGLSAATVVTDVDGEASVTATANGTAGALTVSATVAAPTCTGATCAASFALTNTAGNVANVNLSYGGSSSTQVTSAFPANFCAVATDAGGNPVPGVSIAFIAPANGASASFAPASVLTDVAGQACSNATANTIAGSYNVQAVTAGTLGPIGSNTVNLSNAAAAASQLLLVSGSLQSAPLNTAFALPLVVRALDVHGNPVAGETVTFAAPGAGASANLGVATVTDANGLSSVNATANNLPGSYQVSASALYGNVSFGLSNTANAPDSLALSVVGSNTAVVATPGAYNLSATVTGAGLPVPSVSVTFVVEPSGNGAGATPSNIVAITDAAGIATASFGANTIAGAFTVRAVSSGVSPDANDVVGLSNTAGAVAAVSLDATPSTAQVNTVAAYTLSAVVTDAFGNPINGATVNFDGPNTGAGLNPADFSDVSDAGGLALFIANANGTAGTFAVNACVGVVCSPAVNLSNTFNNADLSLSLIGDVVGSTAQSGPVYSLFAASINNAGGALTENAEVNFLITRAGGIATGDVVVEYFNPLECAGTGDWCVIPLVLNGAVLEGRFGPLAGFPISAGYDATSQLRASSNRGGTYAVSATVDGISSGDSYTSDTLIVNVAELVLAQTAATAGNVGQPLASSVGLRNIGSAGLSNGTLGPAVASPNDANVLGVFTVSGPAPLQLGDVQIEYLDAGNWLPLPLSSCGNNLCGRFGPAAGFPVAAGYDSTTLFRSLFNQLGAHTVDVQIAGVDAAGVLTGVVYASGQTSATIDTGAAASIAIVSGNNGTATVGGNAYSNGDLLVEVRDVGGNPVAGAAVAFNAQFSGGASANFAAAAPTLANGRTSVAALSNDVAGSFTVIASIGNGQNVSFTLSNTAAAASELLLVSGSGQTAPLSTQFAAPLVVRTTDAFGNPVAGETVSFTAPGAGASASLTAAAVTDANGLTEVIATANNLPGTYQVGANTLYGDVSFGLSNTANAPDSLVLSVVGSSTAVVGSAGAYSLSALVTGAGQPVPSVSVSFVVEPGVGGAGASPSSIVALTNAAGVATATFDANTMAGAFIIRALSSGVTPDGNDVASLSNTAGAATNLVLVSGDGQTAPVTMAFAAPLVVRATDSFGNPVAGQSVTFTAPAAGASAVLVGSPASTDANGLASVTATANATAGSYSVSATASFGTPVGFGLSNTAAAPTNLSLTVNGGANATATVGTAAAYNLVATVTDSGGNPVAGVSVTFAGPSSGAGITPALSTVSTNASGIASVTADANSVSGSYSVTATTAGVSPASVSLSNLAGAATTLSLVSGSGQTAPVGQAFVAPLVVRATDALGNPVAGQSVTFAAPGAGASAVLVGSPASTDVNGLASVTATANGTAGSYSVSATASFGSPVGFSLSNTAAAPTNLSLTVNGGANASATVGTAAAYNLVATVTDSGGNPVAGVSVTFAGPSSGAGITPALSTVSTNASGIASVTADANSVSGGYSVTATTAGVSPASVSLSNLAGAATTLSLVSGSGQTAPVGQAFVAPLVVRATDALGNPVAGQSVTFAAPGSGASAVLVGSPASTDANGLASVTATANGTAGSYSVSATASFGSPVGFSLSNTAAAPTNLSLTVNGGANASATVGTAAAYNLVATVTDSGGNPVAGVSVTFAGPSSGAGIAPALSTVSTNASGIASVTADANSVSGSYSVTATTAGVSPASVSLTNLAGAATTLSLASGSGQTAPVGQAFVAPLVVRATDALGNPVAGQSVTFAAPGSGASAVLVGSPATTDANGLASVTATANGTAGSYSVSATASFGSPVGFSLSNTAAAPTNLSLTVNGGANASATVGTAAAYSLVATVTDSGGNPVAGVSVTFAGPSSGAGIAPALSTVSTNASGIASVTADANSVSGSYSVTATTAGVSPASVSLSNLAGAATTLSLVSGSGQTAPVGQAFVAPLVVRATDALGNPVAGQSVTFAAPGSGASAVLVGSPANTDANGLASVTATANATAGGYSVIATAGFGAPVGFSLSNTAANATSLTLTVNGGATASATVATPAAYALLATVLDASSNPVAGVSVTFAGPGTGAGISPVLTSVLTNSSGVATLTADANTIAGSFQVSASVAGVAPASVSIDNLAGVATQLLLVSGSAQSAAVNQAFAAPLVVRATDALGNPVSGQSVSFTAPVAGASANLTGSPAITDASGLASVNATANGTPGNYSVNATAGFGSPVVFNLSNLAAGASALVITAGDGQSAAPGSILPIDPQVRVNDAGGAPVAGVVVSFVVSSGGGSVTEALALSDSNGLATVGSWTLGGSLGSNTLTASVVGAPSITPVVFNATAVGALDVSVTISSSTTLISDGAVHDHVIVVSNSGPNTASPATVSVPLPPGHVSASATWTCTVSGGASCVASGTGSINESVTLPAGSSVTFVTSATVAQGPVDPIVVTATVSAAGDNTPANNTASATTFTLLFRDGFEEIGSRGPALGAISASKSSMRVVSAPQMAQPGSWLVGLDTSGVPRLSVDLLTVGEQTLYRLRSLASVQHSSSWQPMPATGLDLSAMGARAGMRLFGQSAGQQAVLEFDGVDQLQIHLSEPAVRD